MTQIIKKITKKVPKSGSRVIRNMGITHIIADIPHHKISLCLILCNRSLASAIPTLAILMAEMYQKSESESAIYQLSQHGIAIIWTTTNRKMLTP